MEEPKRIKTDIKEEMRERIRKIGEFLTCGEGGGCYSVQTRSVFNEHTVWLDYETLSNIYYRYKFRRMIGAEFHIYSMDRGKAEVDPEEIGSIVEFLAAMIRGEHSYDEVLYKPLKDFC